MPVLWRTSRISNGGYEEVRGLYTFDDDVADVWGKNTDNGLVADNYRIYGFNPGATSVNDRLHTALSSDGLAMDDSRFSTTGAVSKTFYVDENTQYLGVDATKDTADDIDTVYSVGGMKGSNAGNVIVIVDEDESRDALYVILVNADASVAPPTSCTPPAAAPTRWAPDKYVREFWSMEITPARTSPSMKS